MAVKGEMASASDMGYGVRIWWKRITEA